MHYEKPTINKIDFAMGSKYGSPVKTQKIRTNIAGVSVNELTEKYGSPLFVFSEQEIEDKYNTLYEAFSSRYSNIEFGWSYKTNYLNEICRIFHKLGSCAEVVSEFEYQKARALGIEGKDIIFNGPYKPKKDLKIAVQEGAKIHVDHLFELNDLEEIADELEKNIKRDLEQLLNSRKLESCLHDLSPYPEVQTSVLNYGIDEYAGLIRNDVNIYRINTQASLKGK